MPNELFKFEMIRGETVRTRLQPMPRRRHERIDINAMIEIANDRIDVYPQRRMQSQNPVEPADDRFRLLRVAEIADQNGPCVRERITRDKVFQIAFEPFQRQRPTVQARIVRGVAQDYAGDGGNAKAEALQGWHRHAVADMSVDHLGLDRDDINWQGCGYALPHVRCGVHR